MGLIAEELNRAIRARRGIRLWPFTSAPTHAAMLAPVGYERIKMGDAATYRPRAVPDSASQFVLSVDATCPSGIRYLDAGQLPEPSYGVVGDGIGEYWPPGAAFYRSVSPRWMVFCNDNPTGGVAVLHITYYDVASIR